MCSLSDFLLENRVIIAEGFSQQIPQQVEDLKRLCAHASSICEIGFNAGHGADVFLRNSRAHVVSFDIGEHSYVDVAKQYIDKTYPGRHTLVKGNSNVTVPKFIEDNPGVTFDLIFVDGGHAFDTALADLQNCRGLAHPDSVVAMDDTIFSSAQKAHWNEGPSLAWASMLQSGAVYETEASKEYMQYRGMSVGKYRV